MKYIIIRLCLISLLILCFTHTGQSYSFPKRQVGLPDFPETVHARRLLRDYLIAPINDVIALDMELIREPGMYEQVFFYVAETDNHIHLCFTYTRTRDYTNPGKGGYVITRNKVTGIIQHIKIFYQNRPDSYIFIQPLGKDSVMDVVLFGQTMQQNVRIPNSLSRIAILPFSTLMELTFGHVDWNFYLPDYEQLPTHRVQMMVNHIRPLLDRLSYAEDGVIDEKGRYVYMSTLTLQGEKGGLNCSGFAKWIVDGIYNPREGVYLPIDILQKRHTDLRGHDWSMQYEELRDPYFGLDWVRNLAYMVKALDYEQISFIGSDVKELRFHQYTNHVGFPLDKLKTILFELAVKEPGYFYLGSVNQKTGEEPALRQHTHIALFFPYFDSQGNFHVSVMESTIETSVSLLQKRYQDAHIHLNRVKASSRFEPPGIIFDPTLRR